MRADTALLLLGHGSTLNADSSAPTYQHAEEIRRRGSFAEVEVAFWKEEPNFRQALRQTRCRRVYVVPNFISSGYFTEQIIPRELGLTGAVTRLAGQEIISCDPVGLHPAMTEALLGRAREVVAQSRESIECPAQTACLFICGHGTSFNDNSTKIIHEQAAAIRALGLFADCQPVLMEQKPFVKEWRTLTSCPDVIVVPFFIADGLHSFEDIPVLLGLTPDIKARSFQNPHHEANRRLWYATAIGTEKFIADVILEQVWQAAKLHPEETNPVSRNFPPADEISAYLAAIPLPAQIGQILIEPGFVLRHVEDRTASDLRKLSSPADLRELIRLDAQGNFRPLRAAPDLRRGWIHEAGDAAGLRLALDYLYPGEVADALAWKKHQLPFTPWPETAGRQTGRFRIVRQIDETELSELVTTYCERGCLKQRLWVPAAEAVQTQENEIPLLCPEACNFLVAKAREKLKGPGEEE